ncbi:FAD-dependent oxidoreductase [Actinopolymorpha sp. B17G11]|uniref:FAD-dependent oxidoreductase n=1 Tax=Actinopolymorpha sp. B17G11 TaxID=3160861 RepID=UPI0032E375DC
MKAVVCGAGIAGLASAQRLAALGWDVVVLEKAAAPRTQGYMLDFFGPGYDAAEAMGVLPRLAELGYHVEEVTYRDGAGRRRAGMRFAQFAKIVRGRLLSITRSDLERGLRESLPDTVDLRFDTSIISVANDADGVAVTTSDNAVLEADVLVGADGIHSAVRRIVFGEEDTYLRYLGFHTAAFVFDDDAIHAQVDGQFCLTDSVDRQLGFYGLREGKVAVFAVHRTPDPTLPDDPREAIRREYASLGWISPTALAACPAPTEVYYDQVAQIELPSWSRGRVVLVGDACGAVSLLAGQGASLGIAGGYVLAEHLAGAGTVDAALVEYERAMRPVVTAKQRVARDSVRWFLPRSALQLRMRRAILRLARLPLLDRYVAGSIAGKSTAVVTRLADKGGRRVIVSG